MTTPDLPPAIQIVERAERSNQQGRQLDFARIYDKGTAMNEINIGASGAMKLPVGWQPESNRDDAMGRFQSFTPADHKDVQLALFYRGRRISGQAQQAFHDLLQKPKAELGASVQSGPLREVIGNMGNPEDFAVRTASTTVIGGKKVLMVQGTFKQDGVETRKFFVDTDGKGAIVELKYAAPDKAAFDRYRDQATAAFGTIRW